MEDGNGEEDINSLLNRLKNKMTNLEDDGIALFDSLASRLKNINGKMLGKDGMPLLPTKRVQFDTSIGEHSKEVSADISQPLVVEVNDQVKPTGWKDVEDNGFKSFANVVSSAPPSSKLNFRPLFNEDKVEDSDFVLPMAALKAVKHRFENTLVGFFVGKSVAFPLVKNYVSNTWSKFGFQKVMRDDEGVFFFKFDSLNGVEQVLQQGPLMIRNTPIILNKWTPNLSLSKDEVKKVPVWVKLHRVPVVAYSEDGLSLIASQIGTPIMLDAFTSTMCVDTWGRIGFARALIEVSADTELKKNVIMAVPLEDGTGHTKELIRVEYEWKPPTCIDCHVFGHSTEKCPKRPVEPVAVAATFDVQDDGFTTATNNKKQGKKQDNRNGRHIEGLKFHKPKTSYAYQPKTAKVDDKKSGDDLKLKNPFDILGKQEDLPRDSEVDESSSGTRNTSMAEDQNLHTLDSDSEVEEMSMETMPKNAEPKGASTPSNDVPNV